LEWSSVELAVAGLLKERAKCLDPAQAGKQARPVSESEIGYFFGRALGFSAGDLPDSLPFAKGFAVTAMLGIIPGQVGPQRRQPRRAGISRDELLKRWNVRRGALALHLLHNAPQHVILGFAGRLRAEPGEVDIKNGGAADLGLRVLLRLLGGQRKLDRN